ncbi:MAG TPA: bifunctional histidinol-phosphatase/imidazoleglycerol-phosphate dehydratase HisB [Chitinophagaceae bacterium]|nr:bifunctional histidinol-phosphatase/imidazoleglycerol-phosphate dehydratase HisB [Chitinophagaceae bacterium]
MKRVLFIDRDGTLIKEYPPTYQIDAWEKVEFYPFAFTYMNKIATELDYELVMVSNQDGLGTEKFKEADFLPVHEQIITAFRNEGVVFSEVHIDRSYPHENLPTRKPGIGMLLKYLEGDYDISNSFVIGDRITDVQLAKNLGCKAIWLNNDSRLGAAEVEDQQNDLQAAVALETTYWKDIYEFLKLGRRVITHSRATSETKIHVQLNLDGTGQATIKTGLSFFDHMLDQIARHGMIDLTVDASGDLHIDEHHTIEDVGITMGEAFSKALGNKLGIERYGFALPMDDAEAKVLIDFGGRNWIVWNASFTRERIGDVPTEMFFHFFKSFSDAAKCNLNIECRGENEHHKIEAIFKAFAKAIKMAVKRDASSNHLPSTKGVI